MAYIYQIINDINDKVYVGKTERTLEIRFKEHCQDAFKTMGRKRPLYNAMRKYGISHFRIELLEETDRPAERETYWIEKKDSYHNGYNATYGGEGLKLIDDEEVISLYNQIGVQKEVAKTLNICPDTVHDILSAHNVEINKYPTQIGNPIWAYTTKEEFVKQFSSYGEAARWLIANGYTKMELVEKVSYNLGRAVDQKKRKTAFGFVWYSHEQ